MNGYGSPFANLTPVVKNLLIINVIFFIATLMFQGFMIDYFPAHYFDSPNFKVWQLVSYMFMHSPTTYAHILFNMFALFSFGPTLEHFLGSKRFLNYYLLTGLGAVALQMAVQAFEVYSIAGAITVNIDTPYHYLDENMMFSQELIQKFGVQNTQKLYEIYYSPLLGASGAIFGLLIAFGMLFPNAELFIFLIPFPIKAKYLIPIYIVIELYAGVARFAGDSVAHFAHLGGALFGFILIKLWGLRRPGGFL